MFIIWKLLYNISVEGVFLMQMVHGFVWIYFAKLFTVLGCILTPFPIQRSGIAKKSQCINEQYTGCPKDME